MKTLFALIGRDVKLFFKDKVLFFTSLITPLILLVLYSTFLAKVFRTSFESFLPPETPKKLVKALVGGQLFSSLLAVCCVTVSFCSNMLMVQDKSTGARSDMLISPVKRSYVALAYYVSSVFSTLIICLVATGACLIYVACVGWYMRFTDVLWILLDVLLLVLFGTGLSSVINYFLSSQGQMTAVGTIVSAGYGFVCGAYMPISMFGKTLGHILSFLPGTYGTSLLRNHALAGALAEIESLGLPAESLEAVRASVDCNLSFFSHNVGLGAMYVVLAGSVAVLIGVYVILNVFVKKKIGRTESKKQKPAPDAEVD